jgi:hypothetical protein
VAAHFWKTLDSRTKRIIGIGAFFLAAIIVTCIGVVSPLSPEEANAINQDLEQIRQNVSVQYIFGNNLMICLVMFIPIVGPFFGLWVMYNTGIAVAAQSMSASAQGMHPLLIFLSLFLFPFTWLEFLSYSVGLAESAWLLRRVLQGFGKRELRNVAILIAIVTVTLLVAAIIETALIETFSAKAVLMRAVFSLL